MILSLVVCTIVYILLTFVLTGAVNYRMFDGVGDPLAFIFEKQNLNVGWMQFFVAIAAVIAMTSVLLVFQMGQPRIWMSMSRDGLLPHVFQKIHHKFKTPSFSTIVTGLVVGVPIIFTDKTFVLDFTSIATLFAFVLVCGGVLLIPHRNREEGKFHLPYLNGKYIYPLLIFGLIFSLSYFLKNKFGVSYLSELLNGDYKDYSNDAILNDKLLFTTDIAKISTIIFWVICLVMSIITYFKNYSMIPLMGLTTCLYLLTGMTKSNWLWFISWLVVGLIIYFFYGYRKSNLANVTKADIQ
jgi:basic amino acid/polyamine antiporter, APA family